MRITKTTTNMAARCGIALVVRTDDQTLKITRFDEDGEPYDEYAALYQITPDGMHLLDTLSYDDNDWPLWIADDTSLRSLLPAMAQAS